MNLGMYLPFAFGLPPAVRRSWRLPKLALLALLLLLFGLSGKLRADANAPVERHALETQALVDPESVMRLLPDEIAKAQDQKDKHLLALLYLAKANACRVLADWSCQRDAAVLARDVSSELGAGLLTVRGQIAQARALMALQDLSAAEKVLSEAQVELSKVPSNELSAEVNLAFSSFSDTLGKHALAIEYANRGLELLSGDHALATQARLLRNRSRAQGKLNQSEAALISLKLAEGVMRRINDPKLDAEIHLELARIARLSNDVPAQIEQGQDIMLLAENLKNSQLQGLANEVLGLAALQAGDRSNAEQQLRAAWSSFKSLNLRRDELRVLRVLVQSLLLTSTSGSETERLLARYLVLQDEIEQSEKINAADNFDARLKYAEQKVQLANLEGEAKLARQREQSLNERQRLTNFLFALVTILLVMLLLFLFVQRRWNQKLQRALSKVAESELSYRTLADNARDVVVRMKPNGERIYVSLAVKEVLGWEANQLIGDNSLELVHPDDRNTAAAAIKALASDGGASTMTYRVRHKNGSYVWVEALARLAPSMKLDGSVEIVYSGRDITARVRAEEALRESEHRLRAITDNIPALIAYVDPEERYQFANAHYQRTTGEDHHAMIGHTMREMRGETLYAKLQPHVAQALAGNAVSFEGDDEFNGKHCYFQVLYCPDLAADGEVKGFFALTFDITELKLAQQNLEQLARFDSLTGLANRRHFDERMDLALKRCKRSAHALALLAFDVDQFKVINDTKGHPAGDAVIREFARRLRMSTREEDLLARVGGDEFMLLIEDAESPEVIAQIAEKLLDVVRTPFVVDGEELVVSTSIGIKFAASLLEAEAIIVEADRALYAAKSAGKNTYRMA